MDERRECVSIATRDCFAFKILVIFRFSVIAEL